MADSTDRRPAMADHQTTEREKARTMIQLIVTIDDDDDNLTPEEARLAVQRAINSDLRCPEAQVDIPGNALG